MSNQVKTLTIAAEDIDLAENRSRENSEVILSLSVNSFLADAGINILNPNYSPGDDPKEYEKGGDNTLAANLTGLVVDSSGWYASSLISWRNETSVTMQKCRTWVQYKSDGVTMVDSYASPTSDPEQVTFQKHPDATYFRVSTLLGYKAIYMTNFGDALLDFVEYKEVVSRKRFGLSNVLFDPLTNEELTFVEYLISESYYPNNPTYTEGIIDSPVQVTYPDNLSGVLTLTRNEDELITKIVATRVVDGKQLQLTIDITRDENGNVLTYTIS